MPGCQEDFTAQCGHYERFGFDGFIRGAGRFSGSKPERSGTTPREGARIPSIAS